MATKKVAAKKAAKKKGTKKPGPGASSRRPGGKIVPTEATAKEIAAGTAGNPASCELDQSE